MAGAILTGEGSSSRRKWIISLTSFSIFTLLLLFTSYNRRRQPGELAFPTPDSPSGYSSTLHTKEFHKPKDVTIVGWVFFGRRSRVEILRCYLERNLVDNGGWLDEIHWVQNTDNPDDLEYLEEILASNPKRYRKIDLTAEGVGFVGYAYAWGHLERGKMYFKIDDDVIWFADDAIPRVVTLKLDHPEYLLVSGNIINSPLMGWIHYHMGALHPYFPEYGILEPPEPVLPALSLNPKSWRYQDYPYWSGPDDWFFEINQDPPYDGHRWLRLANDSSIHQTPVAEIEYKTWGTGLKSWAIAAQEHYSFLENLADGRLDLYRFGKPWMTDYERLSINFMVLWADEVLDNLPMDTVDEEWLTKVLPKRLGKSVVVESDALAAHFTFGTQGGVEKTDLLERYRSYAIENACRRKF